MPAEDVTPLFNNYRECVRHLWNVHYRSLPEACRDWDLHDEFEDVCVQIFGSIVLRPLTIFDQKLAARYSPNPNPLPGFRIVPVVAQGTPILINRDLPRGGYWDHPVKTVKPNDIELDFLRYFDFDVQNYREYRYVEVSIHASVNHPEIIGRTALIEVGYTRVMFDKPDS
jgi:hypothetical protein